MTTSEPNAVILKTIRSGKDADEFYHVLTVELADELDNDDPWRDLGSLESAGDQRILASYLKSEQDARKWCEENGHIPEDDTFDAVGY